MDFILCTAFAVAPLNGYLTLQGHDHVFHLPTSRSPGRPSSRSPLPQLATLDWVFSQYGVRRTWFLLRNTYHLNTARSQRASPGLTIVFNIHNIAYKTKLDKSAGLIPQENRLIS
jgi:hypothetical protein